MPFAAEEMRLDLLQCPCPDVGAGARQCVAEVRVRPHALHRLGLHPDQPTARVTGPPPPAWWHAEAERFAARRRG
ncbi:hypothetical protein [Streptomyces sp. NPDC005930]|uniref:hypothetical protein n=1 Tax=Streptomyces sp. NPDC005930 TaxID=3364736 RepID=UPI003698C8C5